MPEMLLGASWVAKNLTTFPEPFAANSATATPKLCGEAGLALQ
jgi:hypothetical protein